MNERYLFRGKRLDNGEWVIGNVWECAPDDLTIIPTEFQKWEEQLSNIMASWKEKGELKVILQDFDNMKKLADEISNITVEKPVDVNNATVGQCTGLRDKNSTLIFEGDILSTSTEISCVVKWNKAQWKAGNDYLNFAVVYGCEVIGNIYDNSELLGEVSA